MGTIVKGWFFRKDTNYDSELMTIEIPFYNISFIEYYDKAMYDSKKKQHIIAIIHTDTDSNLPDNFKIIKFLDKRPNPSYPKKNTETVAKPSAPKPKAKTKRTTRKNEKAI